MNIVEQFKEITTCENCCYSRAMGTYPDAFTCGKQLFSNPETGEIRIGVTQAWQRCDSGLWLFRWTNSPNIFEPLDLFAWISKTKMQRSKLSIIPRSDWPEAT